MYWSTYRCCLRVTIFFKAGQSSGELPPGFVLFWGQPYICANILFYQIYKRKAATFLCGFIIAISVQCLFGTAIVFGTIQTTEKDLFPVLEC